MDNKQIFTQLFGDENTYQIIPEGVGKKGQPRIYHGSIDKIPDNKDRGWGVFFCVNKTDLKGRKEENIKKIRALFIDCDTPEKSPRVLQMVQELQPHCIIESSPGKYHIYWLIENCSFDEYKNLQKKLAAKFGSDKSVHDLARVMRVPGFYHLKASPFLSHVVSYHEDPAYSVDEVVQAYDLDSVVLDDQPVAALDKLAIGEQIQVGERHHTLVRYASKLAHEGVSDGEAWARLQELNARACSEPVGEADLKRIHKQAGKYRDRAVEEERGILRVLADPMLRGDDLLKPRPQLKVIEGKKVAVAAKPERKERKKKGKYAAYQDYVSLFTKELGELRRDIFSGDLMFLDQQQKMWRPALNVLRMLKSTVHDMPEKPLKYCHTRIEDHLTALEERSEPNFILDVPAWDGRDRLAELAQRVEMDFTSPITTEIFEDFLKDWHSKAWQRLYDANVQNRVFLLIGGQGIGKDYWIEENINGAGRFALRPNLDSRNPRDAYMLVTSGMFMNISEFDRTARTEVAFLKDLITSPNTPMRLPYGRKIEHRVKRESYISSCNVSDILRDDQNRRYLLFDVMNIRKDTRFTDADRLQVLAQGRELAKDRYKCSDESECVMAELVKSRSPQSKDSLILEYFDELGALALEKMEDRIDAAKLVHIGERRGYGAYLPNEIGCEIFERIARRLSVNEPRVRNVLKFAGREHRTKKDRGYLLVLHTHEEEPEDLV